MFETSKNPHRRKSKSSSDFQCFFMTWSTVHYTENLTPSSILIFQGASVGTGLRIFYMIPERLFSKIVWNSIFWVLLLFIYRKSKKSVNPMVWRCREFFFSNIFRLSYVFRPDVFRILFFGVIVVFEGIELCAQRIKNQKQIVNPMVWRCREFFCVDQIFFES